MDVIGILERIGFDSGAFFADTINFLIVFIVLTLFVFKPLIKTIDQRRKQIEDNNNAAEKLKAELDKAKEKSEEIIKDAKSEAAGIIKQGHSTSEKVIAAGKIEADAEVEKMIKKAEVQIAREEEKMMTDLRDHSAELISSAVEKVLRTKLDDKADAKLVQDSLSVLSTK